MKGRAASLGAAPAAVRVFLEHKQAKFNQRVQPSDCAIMQPPPSAVPTPASATQATASTTSSDTPSASASLASLSSLSPPAGVALATRFFGAPAVQLVDASQHGSTSEFSPRSSSSHLPTPGQPTHRQAQAHGGSPRGGTPSEKEARRQPGSRHRRCRSFLRCGAGRLVLRFCIAGGHRIDNHHLATSPDHAAAGRARVDRSLPPNIEEDNVQDHKANEDDAAPCILAPVAAEHDRLCAGGATCRHGRRHSRAAVRRTGGWPHDHRAGDPAYSVGACRRPDRCARTRLGALCPSAASVTRRRAPRGRTRPRACGSRASPPLGRTSVPPILHSGPAVATADSAFDLVDFMTSFNSGADTATPALQPPSDQASYPPPVAQEYSPGLNHRADSPPTADPVPQHPSMAQLFAEFMQYLQSRQPVSALAAPVAAPPTVPPYDAATDIDAQPDPQSWTVPNNRGSLPPAPVRNLRAAHFPPPAKMTRARGDFVPSAVHNLAAHRLYPYLLSAEGVYETPMSFVLRMRMLDCLNFDDNAPILNATSAARFGRYGVSIMHYHRANRAAQLAAGSSDANFNLDFGINASPPPAPPCDTYFDLLCAIQGLTTFANSQWHDVMARPLYRLRDDSPFWWREFSAAASRIDFGTVAWAMALQAIPIATAAPAAPARRSGPSGNPNTQTARPTQRAEADRVQPTRPGGLPASVRALIPRAAGGVEPCLRFFGGGMCFGGTRDQCAIEGRTHTWLDDLPPALVTFITKKYGRRRQSTRQRN
ncbi:hypothetical protein PF008_g26224 [Phytophthora fragariae]|uniref:Uncharacterized protein n=1 Tax=Phytophthora fragariae TaxID=53985 RepID=A0A6G0QHP0_9STRA|nr:hypothetical protein PF008_g26224 [Phytophthora fragariae]